MRIRLALAVAVVAMTAGSSAWAQAMEFAVVTTRVVYPGETVSGDVLEEVELVRGERNLSSFILHTEGVIGKVARRTLLPGRMIQADALREPYLVNAGEPVVASFSAGPLTISTTVLPLQPGAAGDMVKVRNADSGRVFTGIVLADGTIRVDPS